MYWTVEARNKIVDYLQYGKPSIEATTVVEDGISAFDSEAVEEESTDELVTRGRGTDTFPKEKEEDAPVDENSKMLGELVEVEGEHNVEPRL